ncbi:hypothetical protein ONZ45_g452 [Pleurotus djamor]|nr:hypothetical protein ONZ45_g452 [Pleurotus djamor]
MATWEVRMSNSRGVPYFFNTANNTSVWDAPEGLSQDEINSLPGAEYLKLAKRAPSGGGKPGQVRASHLLVKHKDSRRPASWKESNITRTKEEAIDILKGHQAQIGDSAEIFSKLASEHSDCSSHSAGGDLGFFGKGQMQKPFEDAAFGLEVGQISDIISTDSGVHLVMRTGLKASYQTTMVFDKAVEYLRQKALLGLPADFTWNEALAVSAVLALSLIFIRQQTRQPLTQPPHQPGSGQGAANGSVPISKGRARPRQKPNDVRLSKILVHPIKSCRGTSVQSAKYTPEGLENDRKWCFIDPKTHKVLTARDIPTMVLVYPQIEPDDASPHGGSLTITIPEKPEPTVISVPLRPTEDLLKTWSSVGDISLWGHTGIDGYIVQCLPYSASVSPHPSEIFSRFFSRDVFLVYKGPRPRVCPPTTSFPQLEASVVYQDMYPLLVMSQENMEDMDEWVQEMIREGDASGRQLIGDEWRNKSKSVTVERFRPNLVFTGAGAYAEDEWEEIAIGHTKEEAQSEDTPVISLVAKCQRCLLPNVSPETGIRDQAVPFKVMMKHRIGVDKEDKLKPCMGVNAAPKASGIYRVGDWVDVRKFESSG